MIPTPHGTLRAAAIQNLLDDTRILCWLASSQIILRQLVEAVLLGMDCPPTSGAVSDLYHVRWPERRDLVKSRLTIDHQGVHRAKSGQSAGQDGRPLQIGDSDHLASGSRRIRQRSDNVHDRGNCELAPNRSDVTHRRVH